ncbi:nischarin isoform X2 [Spea bombifrons]|nr:nischarin isoform X2 [Spea bombifrons]
MKPLQLYAVTQLLRYAKPTWLNGDAKTDLGHILDFTCRLKYLKITGTSGPFGTSNIQEHLLPYDLSIFKSLCQIEVSHCNARNITGLNSCKNTLATMTVQFSAESMKDILVPEALEFDQWEPEGTSLDPITAVVPKWKALTTLDMSHNQISLIDDSVKLIPRVEFLDLSHNIISSVGNLQHLFNLIHLDLSYNNISDLDGVHTKVGNIKTLSLAGNLLERLGGLNKLYSLVNLDLSYNKVAQLEEIRHIGHLPCLENINISHNPLVIIPDYRTKVLAQFGERAAEVCLDNTKTTEKELDTVEVLKAIQKAKETRNQFHHPNKKMSEDSQLTKANSGCTFPDDVSAPSLPRPVSCTRVTDTVRIGSNSTSSNRTTSPHKLYQERDEGGLQDANGHRELNTSPGGKSGVCLLREDEMAVPASDAPPCIPYGSQQQELLSYLSASIAHVLGQSSSDAAHDKGNASSSGPENGYFEMGRHKENQKDEDGNQSCFPLKNTDHGVGIAQLHWAFSVQLQRGKSRKAFASCLVLTDSLIVFFEFPLQGAEADYLANFSLLRLAFYLSYRDLAGFGFLLPKICLTMRVRNGEDCIFVLANAQSLQELSESLCARCPESSSSLERLSFCNNQRSEELVQRLTAEHNMALDGGEVKGCFPVRLFYRDQQEDVFTSTIQEQSGTELLPTWVFLTPKNLILLEADFDLLSGECKTHEVLGNPFFVKKIPLPSVTLHLQDLDGNVLQLLMGYRDVTAFFVLPDDKLNFLTLYKLLRTSLQCVKDVFVFRPCETVCEKIQLQTTRDRCPREASASHPSQCVIQKLCEENPLASHLPSPTPLNVISKMNGKDILDLFRGSVSEADSEELRFFMWSSVIFYKEPDVEATSCVLLSSEAIYFLFVDSELDSWNERKTPGSCHLSRCLVIRFSDLLSVNIGLFDQYFRLTGPSASHVVTCVTRDSYSTHTFIQHLMSALSLMARTPSPEPLEKDFYSEFGNKNTGKIDNYELIHSSRVKFIYPNEEEIGDLTFIVKEKSESSAKLQSLNILLYVLAFQVITVDGGTQDVLLQPKTLILTNSDLFLFNEDYISYPLPEFAKEPPKRDKYQLIDGWRIRDLDRVLLGYQTYPQTLTFVFDDVPIQDLTYTLSVDHFGESCAPPVTQNVCGGNREVHLDIFIPSADCREKLISLLARQWEILCGRELPLELTG